MAGNFDAHYKWLGIPPKDQPPNFYRFLGIELYESDPDVITSAAEQRLRHVQSFQSGEYALISQKMQKKIICVRDYLLDDGKKADYDKSLKLQLQHKPGQAAPPKSAQAAPRRPAQAAPPIQASPGYQVKPQAAQPFPAQSRNTDYSTNPVVIFKETMAWFRQHKKVTATIIKLGYAAVAAVILMIVVANGKNLLSFVVGKSSDLIEKVTGSTDTKPPERVTRTRTIGSRTDNAETSTANAGGENAVAAAPGGRNNTAAPPPVDGGAGADKGGSAEAANSTDQGADASSGPAEITSLNLPSGKIFKSRLFKVELSAIADLFKDPGKDDPVLCVFYPNGQILALSTHTKGVPNGITMAFYEDHKPKTYVAYTEGAMDGILKLWNEKGERIYWCQYEKGERNGFCCYFKENAMQLILEIDHEAITGVHLLSANGELKKSFSSTEQASADKVAQKLLDEVDGLDTELKLNEGVFKRQVKDEVQRLHQEKTGPITAQKRNAIQERTTMRTLQSQVLIKSLRNFCSL